MTTQRPLDPLGQHLGLRLRKIRTRRHMSLSSVGEFIEVSAQQIARYESGQHRISAVSLYRLARAMDIPLSWFFSKFEEQPDELRLLENMVGEPRGSWQPTGKDEQVHLLVSFWKRLPTEQQKNQILGLLESMLLD
ncbi:MAG: helix-turn-helix transcriptional regulator [gamma proteobacterium endosymbiont of Lamellibrachia anaximandri]|nr:helix-turn-helix transcriptional regulator [gamma proteobacterium endosymbiont of Lamellibrachia anaximandri]MBL3619528.1 helix-turn-helix transcriptional regulator [gamma proteobacterium endosymbiont of Lamellibrachia anaximandri]